MIHDLDTLAYRTLELVVGFSVCVQLPLPFHFPSPASLSFGYSIFMPTPHTRFLPCYLSCERLEYSFQKPDSSFYLMSSFHSGLAFSRCVCVWQRARRILLLSTFTHLHMAGFRHDFCMDQLQLSVKKVLSTSLLRGSDLYLLLNWYIVRRQSTIYKYFQGVLTKHNSAVH